MHNKGLTRSASTPEVTAYIDDDELGLVLEPNIDLAVSREHLGAGCFDVMLAALVEIGEYDGASWARRAQPRQQLR